MKYKLKEIFDLQMGKTPARNNDTYWNTKDYKWISIADLTSSDKYINDTKEHISKLAVLESGIKLIPANTVVMSFKLSIGKTAILYEDMYSNEAIMAFHDKHIVELLPEYIYYLIKAKNWNDGSNRAVMGQTLNKATLSEIEVDIHTIKEQRKIVELMSSIENVIYKRSEQLQKLEDISKARFVEMFGDIKHVDCEFETRKLGEVASIGSSHRVFTTEFVDSGVPFYRGTEISDLSKGVKPKCIYYISEEHYNRIASDNTKPKIGDLLMPSICNKGQVWMVDTDEPFYYKDGRVLCISPNRKIFNTRYLECFMKEKTQEEYAKLGSGSTFAEFKIFLLRDIDILVPSIELQNQFSAFVEQVNKSKVVSQHTTSNPYIQNLNFAVKWL